MDETTATNSTFFQKAMRLAGKIATNAAKAMLYLTRAGRRLMFLKGSGEAIMTLRTQLTDLIDMLKAYYNGEYKHVPYKTLVKALGAVIYFVFIIDLIPDFIPFFGLMDDVAVVAWVVKAISNDIERYKMWRDTETVHVEETQQTEDPPKTVGKA